MPIVKKSLVLFAVLFTHLAQAGQPSSPAFNDEDLVGIPRGEPVKVHSHNTVLKFHPLPMAGGMLGGMLLVPVEMEFVLDPHLSLSGTVTPLAASINGIGVAGIEVDASARVYLSGNTPDGFWFGFQIGVAVASTGIQTATAIDLQPYIGYQWVSDNGFTIGLAGGLSVAAAASERFPLVIQVPVGFAW